MSKSEQREQFVAVFVANAVKRGAEILIATRMARQVMRHAATYQKLQLARCERSLTDHETAAEAATEKHILALLDGKNGPGAKARFSGDPRGCTVKLVFPSGHNNTWGGADDGWGVPC